MDTTVATSKDFQERMFDNIRENFGKFLTDEDMSKLVQAALDKAFFAPGSKPDPRGWGSAIETEAPFITLVRKAADARLKLTVEAAVDKWAQDNPDAFKQAVDTAIAKGVYGLIQQHFEMQTKFPMQMLGQQIVSLGRFVSPNGGIPGVPQS